MEATETRIMVKKTIVKIMTVKKKQRKRVGQRNI